ncbi:MAG TPA: ATP-binding protein [Patescibacteria group bacterium]|nr:ATP-binding protein [Patescibacteria group bacterium]
MFDIDIQAFQIILSFITFFASTSLGIFIYLKDKTSWTNRLYAILTVLVDFYIVVNYISLHPLQPTPESQLFWVRAVMFVCSFIGPTLILLVSTFPGSEFVFKKKHLWPLGILMLVSAAASLLPLVFTSIEYPNGNPVPTPGPGIVVFLLDFVGLFILSFGILIYKFIKSSGAERFKMMLFLLGVLSTFSLMGLMTVIAVVIFKSSAGVFLGPLSFVILTAFVAYAVAKHGLFNIKIVSTKLMVAFLLIIFGSRIFVFESWQQFGIDTGLFILVMILGYSLVRSATKEWKQKEESQALAHSLEKANIRLQELDKQKTEFLSIAAHQLRTPLSIIKGYVELVKDGAYGKINQKMGTVLSNVEGTNEHLVKLVDEFLDISRIEQGRTKYNFESGNICETITSVVEEMKMRAEEKGLAIAWSSCRLPKVTMDAEKVRHVVFNFIDNAIKYAEAGEVVVETEDEGDGITVRVRDSGIGFEKNDQVNFYQKFYRGDNVKGTNVNGTGLGLYVCRKFIEAHGGKVWARSQGLGKGSEFGFWLPYVPVPQASAVTTPTV